MTAMEGIATRHRRASALPPDERREMIIATTLPLLLEHGELVTTHDIAAAAGIAEGTIFRVFPSKDALIGAVIDHTLDVQEVERAIAAIDPSQPLEACVTEVVALVRQRVNDIWRLMSAVGTRFREHAKRPTIESPALVALMTRHRRELSIPPAEAATLLRSLTFAMTSPMLLDRPFGTDQVVRLFLHGASRPC
jgi:AcrR family transcriptional regulator